MQKVDISWKLLKWIIGWESIAHCQCNKIIMVIYKRNMKKRKDSKIESFPFIMYWGHPPKQRRSLFSIGKSRPTFLEINELRNLFRYKISFINSINCHNFDFSFFKASLSFIAQHLQHHLFELTAHFLSPKISL